MFKWHDSQSFAYGPKLIDTQYLRQLEEVVDPVGFVVFGLQPFEDALLGEA